jgi:HD-GYP domain-containing protein (c-di-GMP phosphodiesterase class II)
MISNRTYRLGLGLEKTLQELQRGKGTQFDPYIIDAFFSMIDRMGKEAFHALYCSHATPHR